MSMLSLFPQLLDWSWYVPFFLRMFLAFYTIGLGVAFIKKNKEAEQKDNFTWTAFGILVIALGFLYLLGIYTQIAGVIGFSLSLVALAIKRKYSELAPEPIKFYVLIGLVSLTLLFLGAGPYAFDLPL